MAALDEVAAFDADTRSWAEALGPAEIDRALPSGHRRLTPRWYRRYTRLLVLADLVAVPVAKIAVALVRAL